MEHIIWLMLYSAIFCLLAYAFWRFVPAPTPIWVNIKGILLAVFTVMFLFWLVGAVTGHGTGLLQRGGPR